MSNIKFSDSELYELLLEVCNNEYMPTPVCTLTRCIEGKDKHMTAEATSIGTIETISTAVGSSKESIKEYISKFINDSLKNYKKSFCFYPYKILKSNKGSLIIRGAFQEAGWITNFKVMDLHRIKGELDRDEQM
jgi:hypothetical protein